MQVDFSKSNKEGSYTLYPEGTYHVEIVDWKSGKAKTSDNPQIEWSAIIKGPKTSVGGTVKDWITLTEASLWRLGAFLTACLNYDVAQLPAMDTTSIEFENLLNACKGRRMFWVLIQDSYGGKPKNKTAQRDPYLPDPKNVPFDPASLEDIPEWVKK